MYLTRNDGASSKEYRREPERCADPTRVRRVPSRERVLSHRGRSRVPSRVAVTERDRFTVAGLIRHLGRVQPDHEMFVLGDERRTWGDELDAAARVAQALARDGLQVGDRVAFLDRNGLAYFDFLFGGAFIGAVNVAVNWRLAPREMEAIIDDSMAPVLVVHPEFLPALSEMEGALPRVRRIVILGTADEAAACYDGRAVTFGEWIDGCGT